MLNANPNNTGLIMNSPGSIFSNDINEAMIGKKICQEFEFFDKEYFQKRERALISIYLTGIGQQNIIPLVNGLEHMEYKSLFDYIYSASKEYTKTVGRPSK